MFDARKMTKWFTNSILALLGSVLLPTRSLRISLSAPRAVATALGSGSPTVVVSPTCTWLTTDAMSLAQLPPRRLPRLRPPFIAETTHPSACLVLSK